MLKSVLFDLDGALLDRNASLEKFIAAQYDRLTVHLNHIPKMDYMTRFIELDCRGHVWKDEVYQSLVAEFEIDGLSSQELLNDYETQFMFHCVPFRHLVEMLDVLKEQGYLLGIVSNGLGTFQTRSIEGLGIQGYFDTVVISEIEQVRKPQAEIFHKALQRLGMSAKEGVFVGDNPEADILGAKGVGLRAIWKRSPYWSVPKEADGIINELIEILPIIQQFK
jgi:putative hydrolase of the HAD superfamily